MTKAKAPADKLKPGPKPTLGARLLDHYEEEGTCTHTAQEVADIIGSDESRVRTTRSTFETLGVIRTWRYRLPVAEDEGGRDRVGVRIDPKLDRKHVRRGSTRRAPDDVVSNQQDDKVSVESPVTYDQLPHMRLLALFAKLHLERVGTEYTPTPKDRSLAKKLIKEHKLDLKVLIRMVAYFFKHKSYWEVGTGVGNFYVQRGAIRTASEEHYREVLENRKLEEEWDAQEIKRYGPEEAARRKAARYAEPEPIPLDQITVREG